MQTVLLFGSLLVLASTTLRPRFNHLPYSLRTCFDYPSTSLRSRVILSSYCDCASFALLGSICTVYYRASYVLRATIVQLLVKLLRCMHACEHACERMYVRMTDRCRPSVLRTVSPRIPDIYVESVIFITLSLSRVDCITSTDTVVVVKSIGALSTTYSHCTRVCLNCTRTSTHSTQVCTPTRDSYYSEGGNLISARTTDLQGRYVVSSIKWSKIYRYVIITQ
jgi:hypothetical protein